jgi:hypothetical protein
MESGEAGWAAAKAFDKVADDSRRYVVALEDGKELELPASQLRRPKRSKSATVANILIVPPPKTVLQRWIYEHFDKRAVDVGEKKVELWMLKDPRYLQKW